MKAKIQLKLITLRNLIDAVAKMRANSAWSEYDRLTSEKVSVMIRSCQLNTLTRAQLELANKLHKSYILSYQSLRIE